MNRLKYHIAKGLFFHSNKQRISIKRETTFYEILNRIALYEDNYDGHCSKMLLMSKQLDRFIL